MEDTTNSETPQERQKHLTLSNDQRWAIYNAVLFRCVDGSLKHGTTKEVSTLFSVPEYTVRRIWKRGKESLAEGSVDVNHKKRNCGRKKVQVDLSKISEIPYGQRTTLRSLSHGLQVKCTTLFRLLKDGKLHRHNSAIKPFLKEGHKRARLQFCISMLEDNSLSCEPKFVGMYNTVHIDEKWFYMTKSCERYYLLPSEEDPQRKCQNKNFIGKVMFLVAMARPRFDAAGNEVFSGKIGVFPLVTFQPAQRKSKKRDAGTLEIKPITSVKRETIKEFLIRHVMPKIQEVWPREDLGKIIFIQQDNARTHINPNDADFMKASSA